MNVSLSLPLEEYIAKKVESGMYKSASEVIREGLRSLQEKEREKERKEKLDILLMDRLAQYQAGETAEIPLENGIDDIIKGIKERMAK